MKYIILVLWTFSLFLLMFSSFPFRVECRPTRAMGPGPPYLPGTGVLPQQYSSSSSSSSSLGVRATGGGRFGFTAQSCPVMEGPGASSSLAAAKPANMWPELYSIDVTEKVWDTSLVLEGMARSRSEVRSDGTYGVTFDLIRVVKGDAPLLQRRKQFRLQFLDNPSAPSGGSSNQTTTGVIIPSSSRSPAIGSGSLAGGGSSSSSSSSRNTNPFYSSSLSSSHHLYNNHGSGGGGGSSSFNRALDLRSNINSQSVINRRISSSVAGGGGGGGALPSSSSSSISLKSSNLHSNYVSHQQLQQQRRSYIARPPRTNLTTRHSNLANFNSNLRNLNNNPSETVQHQQLQFLHRNSNFERNVSSVLPARSRSVRVPRSNNKNVHNLGEKHGRRHGRVMGPRSVVNSASGGGGGGVGKCLPPRATVKTGRKYFVFAAKAENHFVAVFSPELANKRNTKAVESILCKGCGQAPSLVAQKEAVLQPKERLRLRCRLRAGNPIPVLTWYKDGRLVNLTDPRYRLRAKRRQSVLVIRRAKEMDTGVYKCEGKNAFGLAHATMKVTLAPPTTKPPIPKPIGTTPTPRWDVPSTVCPFDSYCLNGGACSYYPDIGEYVCQCAEGYKGQRCELKDYPNKNSGSYLSYFCNVFGTNNPPDYPCSQSR